MKLTGLLLVVILACPLALAGSGGSAYSIFGIGDIRYQPFARSSAMGFTGIGFSSPTVFNPSSPGSWSRINRTRVEVSFLYEGFTTSDGSRTLYRASGDFNGAGIAIPISTTSGVVFVGGFLPYSNVDYSTFTRGSQAGIDYTINHTGEGGLTRGFAGLSYSPWKSFSLGSALEYTFGIIDRRRVITATSTTALPAVGGTVTEASTLNGLTYSLGGVYTGFGDWSDALHNLSAGFRISSRGKLNTTSQFIYEFTTERDSSAEVNNHVVIPFAFGVGLSYQAGERYYLSADYFAQAWGSATFNGIDPREIRNNHRFGIGAERLGMREFDTPWLDKLTYRLGFYYDATYYTVNGTGINQWGVTGGVSFPLFGDGRMNIAADYGRRGVTENGLVRDNVLRMIFSLNFSELWFVRYEEE